MVDQPNAAADRMLPPGSPTSNCPGCDEAECKKQVDEIEKKKNDIANIANDQARNKAITGAYNQLYSEDPGNKWIGLAGIASAQVGCRMGDYMGMGQSALGDGNKTIFSSIYPYAAFRSKHGWDQLKKCYKLLGKPIPKKINDAFDALQEGRGRDAANSIGSYEQKDVAQAVYDRHPIAFGVASKVVDPSIPLSQTCGAPNPVPFDGSITDGDARYKYYQKLMNGFAPNG